MSAGAIEGTQGPDYDEVQQLNNYAPAVPVCIEETVNVQPAQALSGNAWGIPSLLFADQYGHKLLNEDRTRGQVTLVSGNSYYIGFSKDQCEGKQCRIPGSTAITIRNGEQIWVMAATADTYVSAICDFWTK